MALDPSASPPSPDSRRAVLIATSRIARVTLHNRGAIVTRRVTPPQRGSAQRDESIIVRVPRVTAAASPEGLRVRLLEGGEARLLSVTMALSAEEQDRNVGELRGEVEELEARTARLRRAHRYAAERRAALSEIKLRPADRRLWLERGPTARVSTSLEVMRALRERAERLDDELFKLYEQIELQERELQAARVRLAHADAEGREAGGISHHIDVALWLALGSEAPPALEVIYTVEQARWWPRYTLKLHDAGRRAELIMQAIIAQASGEDWRDVEVALSTADLAVEATLPRLDALKLGRHQPAPRLSGYRPLPQGLEKTFSAHDQFLRLHGLLERPAAPETTSSRFGFEAPGSAAPHSEPPAVLRGVLTQEEEMERTVEGGYDGGEALMMPSIASSNVWDELTRSAEQEDLGEQRAQAYHARSAPPASRGAPLGAEAFGAAAHGGATKKRRALTQDLASKERHARALVTAKPGEGVA